LPGSQLIPQRLVACVLHRGQPCGRPALPHDPPPRLRHVVRRVVEVQPPVLYRQAVALDLVHHRRRPLDQRHLVVGRVQADAAGVAPPD
jgi:hypothetical protein